MDSGVAYLSQSFSFPASFSNIMTKDMEVLAKWFLNVLNEITMGEENLPILKIRIFNTSQANAFKSDKEKLNSYQNMKENQEYNDLVNGFVSYLLNEGLILEGTHL